MAAPNPVEQDIFHVARRIPAGPARRLYLEQACGDDLTLQARIEALLRVQDDESDFLAPPTTAARTVDGRDAVIGPYTLLRQIGEGGMGSVFLAEQAQPVRRQVALKLLKPGLDSRRVVARFEAERQALAVMDHPNIAKVHDAGTTAQGRPYFVMELVPGVPITHFCDEQRLTPRQRLELFIPVCRAVQHAHQKGVIHRDLKPSNVLVALYDGNAVPKVIDFGVAKAIGPEAAGRADATEIGTIIGTLEYMSPEQAEPGQRDIDTRSDVYSLGVLLYELLTGTTPLSRHRLKEAAWLEMLRIIREEDPPKPSTRLDTTEELPSIAANRGLDPNKLSGLVRGDLDWIVMRCLEKDRVRRYETAAGLARDVERYLNDEPVEAGSPGPVYRVKKFFRRHRGPVVAASLVLLALVAGFVGTAIGLVRAETARRAEAARAEGERRAKETAEKRLSQVEKGIDILGSIFANLDPRAEEKDGQPLRAILGDRLDRAATELEGEAVGDALVVAKLQDRLGRTYLGLGHADKAASLFAKAVATRRAELSADDPFTLDSQNYQALAFEAAGRRVGAIALLEQVRDARLKVLGADHPDTLATLNDLALVYRRGGNLTEAVALFEQVRDAQIKKYGADHPLTLATLTNQAMAFQAAGKGTDAIALFAQVRDARVKNHGVDHPLTLDSINNLAMAYQTAGKMTKAIELLEQTRDAIVTKLGPDHPRTLTVLNNLAWTYRAVGRTDEAIALAEQVRDARVMKLGADHPDTLTTLDTLAMSYRAAGKLELALSLFQQAAAGVEKLKFVHVGAGRIVRNLCNCHERLKQYDEAEVWRRKWLAAVKAKDGADSAAYAAELTGLGSQLLERKKHAAAEPLLRECLVILQKKEPAAWATFRIQSLLGAALLGQRKYAEAEPPLLQGYQGMANAASSPGHPHVGQSGPGRTAEGLERLVQLYDAWGKPAEAAAWRKRLAPDAP